MNVTEKPGVVASVVEFNLPDGCVMPSGSIEVGMKQANSGNGRLI